MFASLNKLQLKLFATRADCEDAAVMPIFHAWIRENALPGLLIDVADYRHVPSGPSVMLVGHQYDLVLDRLEGPLGLLLNAKRVEAGETLVRRLQYLSGLLLQAADRLEHDSQGALAFDRQQLRILANDRLRAANTDSNRQQFTAALREAFGADLAWKLVDEAARCRLGYACQATRAVVAASLVP